jgi:adenylate kinase
MLSLLKTPLGQEAQAYMDRGELVPDQLVLDLIRDRLHHADTQVGWILDGFPRNPKQALFLEELLQEINQVCDHVLNLAVATEVLVERLLGRGRQDDTEEVIRRRLQIYQDQTAPLIAFYRDRQKLASVNGNVSVEHVTQALEAAIADLL